MRVELLDRWERPVPGYSGSGSAAVNKSGLRELVSWKGKKRIQGLSSGFKIRVNFEGERQDIRLYALYVGG